MSSRASSTITFLTLTAFVAACGGGGGEGGGDAGGDTGGTTASPVDAATAGNVAGAVMFTGEAPAMATIDMSGEQVCADKHASAPMSEEVVVGDGGGLANVFVYVKEGLEGLDFPTPGSAVVLDQDGCVYSPHVFGVQAGQDLTLRNSDGVLHNINASPTNNRGFNRSQPVVMDTDVSFNTVEVMIPVRCDVHGWMSAYIGVLDHPYYDVTGPDGSYSLETLPPGDYVIEAWHERYGVSTQNVTVATGETVSAAFTFDASTAMGPVPLGEPLIITHKNGVPTVVQP